MEQPSRRLVEIMARLRAPDGCPWDREQSLDSLKVYLLEESFEVRQALEEKDPEALREELGDLLFQIVFQCRIAEELGWFDFHAVEKGIAEKLRRRHPHVFGEKKLATSKEVVRQWEELKEEERRRRAEGSRLSSVPAGLPALLRALRLGGKAARCGFDWETNDQVFDKVREEVREWEETVRHGDPESASREMGDLLFSLVNVARRMGLDPEAALQSSNQKFVRRFQGVEALLAREGKSPEAAGLARLNQLWEEVKAAEEKG